MLELDKTYLGDCMDLFKQIDDKSVHLILTDIPYAEVNRESNGLRNLNKEDADILTFDLDSFLNECNRVCNGSIYIFCGTEQVSLIRKKFVGFGLSTRHCIWEKTNPSPMNGEYIWLSSIENCIFGKNPGALFNEHCRGAVWRHPSGRSKIHPTEKPLKLFEYLIQVSSEQHSVVLDPCMGSGTTCLAAKNQNRKFIGFERKKEYYEQALKRINEPSMMDFIQE
jgi:site-specific DNA-methyltransferase (adenine-specific)